MRITSIVASPWTLPLRAPFKIAARTATEARNVLVTIATESGMTGVGAAAPVFYVTGETEETVMRDVLTAATLLVDLDAADLTAVMKAVSDALPNSPSARAAIEMALYDIWGKGRRESNWRHFGARLDRLTTDLTIPIVTPAEASALVKDAAAEGFTHFKIKVGDSDGHEADLARIRAIVEAAPMAGLRVDANQAFTPDNCVDFVADLIKITPNVELIEQPVEKSDIAGLKYVRDRVSIPIFADEAAQTPESVRKLIDAQAVDGINIKLMKSGLQGALEIIDMCRTAKLKLMIGCMLESRLGLTAALYIAAGTAAIDYIDLDSHRLISPDPGRYGGFTGRGTAYDRRFVQTRMGRGRMQSKLTEQTQFRRSHIRNTKYNLGR